MRAIFRTARGPRRAASTTSVAAFVGVTPASVTSMFKTLAWLELVTYVPYRGVSLTPEALIEGPVDLDSQLEAKRGLSILASLPERQCRYLALLVAGYCYQEIVELDGVTYTWTNRHITEGLRVLRGALGWEPTSAEQLRRQALAHPLVAAARSGRSAHQRR